VPAAKQRSLRFDRYGEMIMIAALAFSLVAVALGFPGVAMLAFGATDVR
jgi:hypothetical protein